jgi:Sec-independent protein secretion pathway component TatC
MGSRPWIAEPVGAFRTFRASLLAFSATLVALLLIPNPSLTLAGSHPALVSLFVAGVMREVLPAGWILYSMVPATPFFEIYITASVLLALLISSPVISYQIMKFIAPALAKRKRTLYSLVALASVLLAAGALFGALFLADYYLYGLDPFLVTTGGPPVLDAADFYFFVFRTIGSTAIEFTLPVYIYALIRFRSRRV